MTTISSWFPGFRTLALVSLLALPGGVTAAETTTKAAAAPAVRTVEELRARLEAHVTQPRFSGALWGVKIVSLDTGRTLFEHHADRLMSPASNCKLYTGALALDKLGGDYRIVTPISGSAKPDVAGELKGDLIVSGRGDPSWKVRGSKKDFWTIFDPLIAVLEKAGVRHVTGDVVADATWFNALPNGAGWTADDLNDYYGAEISAISMEENYAELRVTPGATVGAPCGFAMVHPHTGLMLDNRTRTVAKDGKRRIEAVRLVGENVVHVFGELPVGDKEELVDLTVPRPAGWFAAAFKEALARKGIRVDGNARSLRWPDAPAVTAASVKLGEMASPPLRELVKTFMKPSQNLETDLIFDHLGELRRTAETPAARTAEENAVLALKDFLKKNGLPADEVRFEEGSGLSRNNLVSANATVALLKFMAGHREGRGFAESLPVAGVDGSLRRRMKGTPAEGNVQAKTGTLRYANSLSGYVKTAAGERLAFALMLNRSTPPAGRTSREEVDDVAVLLAGLAARSEAGR
ncbi:MAG: D-alanyl-D-alanine carboxypeptidase/D-alanyl-D-alanine-endopeptidase [Verrucomicrobia bacterium]|nr:D-alanyl-D-alanine carboxypeptidase/D-alanyl-D-alanine-endopeptidase [Verrucomicrobiota bacterium]